MRQRPMQRQAYIEMRVILTLPIRHFGMKERDDNVCIITLWLDIQLGVALT